MAVHSVLRNHSVAESTFIRTAALRHCHLCPRFNCITQLRAPQMLQSRTNQRKQCMSRSLHYVKSAEPFDFQVEVSVALMNTIIDITRNPCINGTQVKNHHMETLMFVSCCMPFTIFSRHIHTSAYKIQFCHHTFLLIQTLQCVSIWLKYSWKRWQI